MRTARRTKAYSIEIRPVCGGRSKWTHSTGLRGCLAQVSRLVLSGENIRSIRCGRNRLGDDLVTAVVTLIKRRSILQQLAASSGLDTGTAEAIFNEVFIQQAISIQALLQGLSQPSAGASEAQELNRIAAGLIFSSARSELDSEPASTASIPAAKDVLELPLNPAALMTTVGNGADLSKGRTRA